MIKEREDLEKQIKEKEIQLDKLQKEKMTKLAAIKEETRLKIA